MGDDCKPVFSSIGCLYIKSTVWKKSSALSRVTVYEVPACAPPFRLVLTSVATGEIQINTPIAPQLGIKRSRDDFLFFTVRYANDALVSYGVQLKERKFAEQLLGALNLVATPHKALPGASAKLKKADFEISGPENFRLVQHTGPPTSAPTPAAGLAGAGGDVAPWNDLVLGVAWRSSVPARCLLLAPRSARTMPPRAVTARARPHAACRLV